MTGQLTLGACGTAVCWAPDDVAGRRARAPYGAEAAA